MKLQRTDKQLTEQDAIELAEAATGMKATLAPRQLKHSFVIRFRLHSETMNIGRNSAMILATDVPIGMEFTNKALELGYYEIVE